MLTYAPFAKTDVAAYWHMKEQLDRETSYMLYEPGERLALDGDMAGAAGEIAGALAGDFLLAAWDNGRPVGYVLAQRGAAARIAHSAYIVAGVLQGYRGRGVGTALFAALDAWAKESAITRLELTVVCENAPACHLYEKCGFVREGVKRNSILLNGRYVDEYYMAKLLPGE